MQWYLVQRGEAQRKEEDPERPLTRRGRDEVTRMAAFLAICGVKVDQIRHSGAKRAEETALILGAHLSPAAGVRPILGLAPQDEVVPMAEGMHLETRPVMLVGHLPFLSRLAGFLLAGSAEKTLVRFRMSVCICLVKEETLWSLE